MRRVRVLLHSAGMCAAILLGSLVAPSPAFGQYQGHNFKGDFGVNAGAQPPPGLFISIPYFQWNADDIKDADGNPLAEPRFGGFDLRAVPLTVIVVTKKKLLGAQYGVMLALPFSTIKPEVVDAVDEDVDHTDWGFTDMYVVPLHLGWHTPSADFVAGYGFYAPTGRYEAGAIDNAGLGMWSHEIQGGVRAYLDQAKKLTVATTAYFEIHSKKKDLDLKVGNLLTLEGGAAYNAIGIAYYLQHKMSDDSGRDVPVLLLRALNLAGHNHIFGIGPDVTMELYQRGTTLATLNVRYLWDSAAKSSFEGGTFAISMTIGKIQP